MLSTCHLQRPPLPHLTCCVNTVRPEKWRTDCLNYTESLSRKANSTSAHAARDAESTRRNQWFPVWYVPRFYYCDCCYSLHNCHCEISSDDPQETDLVVFDDDRRRDNSNTATSSRLLLPVAHCVVDNDIVCIMKIASGLTADKRKYIGGHHYLLLQHHHHHHHRLLSAPFASSS